MKKKKSRVLAVLYIFAALIAVGAGLYFTDALPSKLSYKIDSFFSGISVPANGDEKQEEPDKPDQQLTPQVVYRSLPDRMYGIWLDLDSDTETDVSYGADAVLREADRYFNYFMNFYANTLFIRPDTQQKYASLNDAAGNSVDILREYLNRARAKSYKCILIADDGMIASEQGNFSFNDVKYYLTNYSFDGVVLSADPLAASGMLYDAAYYLHDAIKSYDPGLLFGTVVQPIAGTDHADKQTLDILNSAKSDFVLIRGDGAIASPSLPFAQVMAWWNTLAGYYPNIGFSILHRMDLVCNAGSEWGDYAEIAEQMRYMWDYTNITGSVFYDAASLRTDKASSAQRIAALLENGASDELKVTSIKLDSAQNTASFTGTSRSGHVLSCNNVPANPNGGAFSLKYPLKAGANTFSFFSCGKEVTYRVFNNSHLIDSYYPQTDINAAKDDTVTITAVCMEGCSVVCTLNRHEYAMTEQVGTVMDGIPLGFTVYACSINFTGSSNTDLNLGNIVITASLGDDKEAVTCGRVTLLKSNSSTALNGFLEFVYSAFFRDSSKNSQYTELSAPEDDFTVSPYKDNGLGTALMCRICDDDTEQLGPAGAYDTYQPDLSCLCKGTLDYVDNMTVSEEGYIRYELRSGISVYGVNCELINNAFAMPENKIAVNRVEEGASSTDIVFNTDWFVPVKVKALPQNYRKGYLEYSYNVSSFTAEYVDVTFCHTAEFYNQSKLSFAADSPFSHSELYAGADGTLILRLYLKKAGQFYGFDIRKDDESHIVLSFKKRTNGSLAGKVIMLDPGHGGLAMTGTALADNSAREADVTLSIALKAYKMLTDQGAVVLMTRTADTALDLDARCDILSEYDPDIFVSIHCDGTDDISMSGTHTFYFRPYSQPLASAINTSLVSVYRNYIYSPTDTNYPAVDRGIKYYPFYVTRMNQCPAVLVETGFMTNPVEGSILANDNCQYWIAEGIVGGIINYFITNNAAV